MKIFLNWKIRRIEAGIKYLLKNLGIRPLVWSFGAYYIDPRHMVFVAGVQTDLEKEKLNSDRNIQNKMRELLVKCN